MACAKKVYQYRVRGSGIKERERQKDRETERDKQTD